MRRINIILVVTLAAIISFAGCKKAEDVNNSEMPLKTTGTPPGTEASSTIRTFANFDLLNAEVEKTTGFTYEQLVAYEQSIRFDSYGKMADQAMKPLSDIVEEAMATEEEESSTRGTLIQMIEDSPRYIQIIIDEEGEEHVQTKYCGSSFRYVMNINRMFKVDTLYFKVFEGGHVSCATAYYNQLLSMSENDFSILESNGIYDVFKYGEGDRGNHGTYVKKGVKDGKTWLYVELVWSRSYLKKITLPGFEDSYTVAGSFYVATWAEHLSCGKWWKVKHTYTNDITASIEIGGYSGCPKKTGSDKGTTTGQKRRTGYLVYINGDYYKGNNIYIHSSSGWGQKPNLRCYMNLN